MDEFKNNQDWQPLYILCGLDKCSINIILCWNKVGIWNLVANNNQGSSISGIFRTLVETS